MEPELTQRDPKAYYYWLLQNRMPQQQAIQMVDQRFGGGKTKEQAQKEAAKNQQTAGLAQVAGTIGGLAAGRYAYDNFGKLVDKITGKAVEETVAKGAEGAVQAGANAAAPVAEAAASNVIAQGAPVPSGFSPVATAPDGGVIIAPTNAANNLPAEVLKDPGFLSKVNWGSVAQGGLGAAQILGAYNAYRSGDKGGAALGGATGAANVAAATGALNTASGSVGSYAIPGLNIATGAYGGYKTAQMLSDAPAGAKRTQQGALGGAAAGASIGAGVDALTGGATLGLGTAIGATIGATVGAIGSVTGSSKKKPQMMRDSIRRVMKDNGILDDKYQGTLADGSTYDFGKDGSTLKWKNIDKVAEANPNSWSAAVNLADALSTAYGVTGQKASDIAAWYAKAAVSNANDNPEIAKQNVRHFAKQQGFTFDMIKEKLDSAMKDNRISTAQYNNYLAGAQDLVGGATAAPTQAPAIARPGKGQVGRQSAGLYRDDKGRIVKATSMRSALERAYNKKDK